MSTKHEKCRKVGCESQQQNKGYCLRHLQLRDPKAYIEYRKDSNRKNKPWKKERRIRVLKWISPNREIKCQNCGDKTYEFMAIANIKGGGRALRASIGKSGDGIIAYIIKNYINKKIRKTPFRSLCHNCNRLRLYEVRYLNKLEVISHYSKGKMSCECCNEGRIECLEIHHVNGGGTKHRKQIKVWDFYDWLIKKDFPPGYAPLCANCNNSLGVYKYCPHNTLTSEQNNLDDFI